VYCFRLVLQQGPDHLGRPLAAPEHVAPRQTARRPIVKHTAASYVSCVAKWRSRPASGQRNRDSYPPYLAAPRFLKRTLSRSIMEEPANRTSTAVSTARTSKSRGYGSEATCQMVRDARGQRQGAARVLLTMRELGRCRCSNRLHPEEPGESAAKPGVSKDGSRQRARWFERTNDVLIAGFRRPDTSPLSTCPRRTGCCNTTRLHDRSPPKTFRSADILRRSYSCVRFCTLAKKEEELPPTRSIHSRVGCQT
jgi:hypothetical protein